MVFFRLDWDDDIDDVFWNDSTIPRETSCPSTFDNWAIFFDVVFRVCSGSLNVPDIFPVCSHTNRSQYLVNSHRQNYYYAVEQAIAPCHIAK